MLLLLFRTAKIQKAPELGAGWYWHLNALLAERARAQHREGVAEGFTIDAAVIWSPGRAVVELPLTESNASTDDDFLDVLELDLRGPVLATGRLWTAEGPAIRAEAVIALLEKHPRASEIRITIDSPGGDFAETRRICSALRGHGAHITCIAGSRVLGNALQIFVAGHERIAASPRTRLRCDPGPLSWAGRTRNVQRSRALSLVRARNWKLIDGVVLGNGRVATASGVADG